MSTNLPSSSPRHHRIGRTGRRENKGVAYTFFTDEDEKQAADLVKVLQQAKQDVHPQLLAMAQRGGGRGGSRFRQFGSWPKRRGADFGDDYSDAKRVKRFDSNGDYGSQRSFGPSSRY